MIGRVYRGGDVGGLQRYLYGPGRHNEHESPRLVASWDLTTPAELATLEPRVLTGTGATALRDFGPMTASMELATGLRRVPSTVAARQVWHCPLRVAPGDRVLTDAEWGEIARDVMHRTGIAERGDDGGCRWIAVRHDAHSVHLVAVLARQDGRPARLSHDHLRVREACRAAERRLGLVETAPADRTAATHVTRAEVEKTRRTRRPGSAPDRFWLRDRVQLASISAPDAARFLDRLDSLGVVVRERRDANGTLSGYAVARPASEESSGQALVFYGGGKLAPDLTLPKLQARWQHEASVAPLPHPPRTPQSLAFPVDPAVATVDRATRRIHEAVVSGDPEALREAGALARVTAQVLDAAALTVGSDNDSGLRRTARLYDRASREPSQLVLPATPMTRSLRDVAFTLLQAGQAGHSLGPVLLGQVLLLIDAVRELRQTQGRVAQARAAQHAAVELRRVVQTKQRKAAQVAVATSARRLPHSPCGLRRPPLPPQGAPRSR